MSSLSLFAQAVRENPEQTADHLRFNRGIEREALRVTPDGHLATTPHPESLGSKLTHPRVTTDFCESQLELITPVHQSATDALADLRDIHGHVVQNLRDEHLWSASMPCVLQDDSAIPLAYYGESNLGRLKTTYRSGLGYRYGRGMQTICAVHYNFSLTDSFWPWLQSIEGDSGDLQGYITRRYFDLMRNFRHLSWLLTYLFGASPAVCNSFIRGKQHNLKPFDEGTAYLPYATSLRSGNLGYQSNTQADHMNVCFNGVESYVASLATAICTEYEPYRSIGVEVDGHYRQVNAGILQSEAEFYSSIRAKRVPGQGENFLACLLKEGVQYIEVRLLDVNPYLPMGIDETQIHFLDAFLLYCLLADSPQHDETLCSEVRQNAMLTVTEGRREDLVLKDNGRNRVLREWGSAVLDEVMELASFLDDATGTKNYAQSVDAQKARMADPALTPSGRILADMTAQSIPFFRLAMNQATEHNRYFAALPIDEQTREAFQEMAETSRQSQRDIESADSVSFSAYLKDMLAAYEPLAETRD